MNDERPALTLTEAAKATGVSRKTLRRRLDSPICWVPGSHCTAPTTSRSRTNQTITASISEYTIWNTNLPWNESDDGPPTTSESPPSETLTTFVPPCGCSRPDLNRRGGRRPIPQHRNARRSRAPALPTPT